MKRPLSLSNKILIGLLSGLFFGFFVGEYAAYISFLGDVYIGLLQMTVLPYIFFSLVLNIGKLSIADGKNLILNGIKALAILLGVGLIILIILPFALPEWNNASFFSKNMIIPPEKVDFVNLYIPSNPFKSLSDGLVPAIVLFSIFLGIALLKVENKTSFLHILETITKALNQINKMVVKVSPYGVFAIASNMVISVSLEELERLQGYILIYTLAIVILSFWTLPRLISSLTPFTYKDLFKYTKAELLTIFATSKIIVVLPQLIEDLKQLFRTKQKENEEAEASIDVIMPLAYPFPNLGTFLILFFIPFGAWYSGMKLGIEDYPIFLGAGAMSSFTAPITFIPFLLDVMEIPSDLFNLFVVSTVYTDRIRVVLGAIFLISLSILSVSATFGLIKINWKGLITNIIGTLLFFIIGLVLINIHLKHSFEHFETNEQKIMGMTSAVPDVEMVVLKKPSPLPAQNELWEDAITRIQHRGKIRVGFFKNNIPFSYFNQDGQLVGHDIDMAKKLAADLGVALEFAPADVDDHRSLINRDYYDIIMSGTPLSGKYAENITTTEPYMDVNLAMLVKDSESNYGNLGDFLQLDTVVLAYRTRSEFAELFQSYCPNIQLKKIESIQQFYELNEMGHIDAMVTSFENGAIQTMLKPAYQVVNPLPFNIALPLVYPVGNKDLNFQKLVSDWIKVKQKDGTTNYLYDHWILGKKLESNKKQWSVIRNVFHWVE